MRSASRFTFIAVLALSFFVSTALRAGDSIDTILKLSKELNKLQMYDYSEDLLKLEIAKNPPDADLLKIQLAVTYFMKNQADQAESIIATVTTSSKHYADSRRVLGMEAFKKGKTEAAVKYLEDYFSKATKELPQTESGKEDYKEAVQYLAHIYTQMGDATKAAEVMKRLDLLLAEQTGADKRYSLLLQIQTKFNAIEQQIEEGKKEGFETTVNDAIKQLDDLMWEQDSIAAFAYIEKARGLYFLGRYDDGLREIEDPGRQRLFEAFDEVFKEEGSLGSAPSPSAFFWIGKINFAKAEKAENEKDKTSLYGKAMQSFYGILEKYDSYVRLKDVTNIFIESRQRLEQLGKKIKIPREIEAKLSSRSTIPPDAEKFFADAKYDKAAPLYQQAIVKSRKSGDAADILAKMAYCYVQSDQMLEALAIAGYLADYYPEYKNTPLTLLQVGESLWQKGRQEKDPELKRGFLDDALSIYEYYLNTCPSDQYASSFSAKVANTYYDRASELAKKMNELPQGKEKVEMSVKVQEAFAAAIPKFQRIVKNYLQSDHGPKSYYLLGCSYTYAKDYKAGAETLLAYCDFDIKSKKPDLINIADAKFRAGDNYFQMATALNKEAREIREKAEKALSAKKKGGASAKPDEEKAATEKPVEKAAPAKDEKKPEQAPGEAVKEAEETPEKMIEKANLMEKDAKKYFAESIKNLVELLGPWRKKDGILEKDKSEKMGTIIESATMLLGWVYDSAGEKDKACKVFADFIKEYPTSKQIPPAMFRLGTLYLELEKPDIAAQVLEKLSTDFPESKEGRNALSSLGRSMYDIGKYDKCIESFSKAVGQNVEMPVQVMRWVVEKLPDCGGTHPKEGAMIALKVSEQLMEMLKKPVYSDWLPKEKVLEITADPKEEKKMLGILREKLLYDSANAAFWSEDYNRAVATLQDLLANEDTPYYVDGRILRAMANRKLKKFDDARKDYGAISMIGISSKKNSLYFKAQCLSGDAYFDQPDYQQAYGSYHVIAMLNPEDKNPDTPEQEMKEEISWIEYAIYRSAVCADKLSMAKEKGETIEKYQKFFPSGKYIQEIKKLATSSSPADLDNGKAENKNEKK